MKLGMQEHTDVSVGVQDEVAVSFEANAVAFYAQITGLAKDKIGYPIREICTNAWDASRGNFEVHLPTPLSPVFRVRDYGTGMTPEQMNAVYARMYASTKRDSNDSVGGWGLGRFSPFAYLIGDNGAGSYNVTSYTDGMMRTYVLSVSAGGSPMMRRLTEMPTDEPSGLEVAIPVRREDIHTFHRRAENILWSFHPRPKITPAIEWAEPIIDGSGEGWTNYRWNSVPFSGPHVRMGCVMYPFDLHQIDNSGFLGHDDCIVFDAPIGSLKVTLSREELAYDSMTKETLKSLVSSYEANFLNQLQNQINAEDSLFKAVRKFEEVTSNLGVTRQERLETAVTWNSHAIRTYLDNADYKAMRLFGGWSSFDKFDNTKGIRMSWAHDATVVIEHHPCYSGERFKMADLVGKKILWVRCKRAVRDQVLEHLGNPEVIDLDAYKVPLAKRDKKTIRKRKTLMINDMNVMKRITQDVDLAEGGYYVTSVKGFHRRRGYSDGYEVTESGKQISGYHFETVLSACRRLGVISEEEVILVKTPDETLGENWTLIGEDLIDGLKSRINIEVFTGLHRKTINSMNNKMVRFAEIQLTHAPDDVRSFMTELTSLVEALKSSGSNTATDTDIAFDALSVLGETVEVPEIACPIEAINLKWTELHKKYPLFGLIVDGYSYWGGRSEREKVTDQLNHYFSLLARPEPVQIKALDPANDTSESDYPEGYVVGLSDEGGDADYDDIVDGMNEAA